MDCTGVSEKCLLCDKLEGCKAFTLEANDLVEVELLDDCTIEEFWEDSED